MKRVNQSMIRLYRFIPLILFAGLLIFAPFLDDYFLYILAVVFLNVILATGLNLLTGYTGQISLCHASFLGIGAYSCTILMIRANLPYPLALLGGASIAGGAGFLVGIPALRLRGLYLAMVTLGFGEIIHLVLHHWQGMTGGPLGLRVPAAHIGPFVIKSELSLFYLFAVVAMISVLLARNLIASKFGRAFRAIGHSELGAQSSGVDLARYKTFSFALSAFYAGIAGGLYCQLLRYLSPDPFGLFESIQYLTMIVLGGMGSLMGSVMGAILLSVLPEVLRDLKDYQELIFSLLLMLFILFMPKGIYGMFRSLTRGRF
jgi:branched-chain amino acid transport system permease protein